MKIPLQSRLNTSDEPITSVSEHPQFQYKNSIMWNGTIRNAYTTQGSGFVSTTGHEVNIEQTEKGVAFKYGDKTLRDNYNWVLANKYKTSPQATGKRTSSVIYNNKLYTIYDADDVVSLIISNRDGSNPEQIDLDCSSAVLSSVYKVNKAPILWLVKTTEVGNNLFDNAVRGYSLEDLDTALLSYDTDDYIPLGDCNSATVFMQSNGKVSYVLGCDDIDHNRSKVFVFNKNTTEPTIYKWFGCVGPSGIITGEPIPDPDMFKNIDRNSNGTYSWDMYGTTTNYIKGQLIGGYIPPVTSKEKFDKIVIESWNENESVRYNMSSNDTKLEDDDVDPVRYFVTNFADNQGIYYDYGQGWLKTYVRKVHRTDRVIEECYLYTYGAKRINNLPYRKESLICKGNNQVYNYTEGNLNQRIYTVGRDNKGSNSMLGTIPCVIEIIPSDNTTNTQYLDMQLYGLATLSFSWMGTLITTGAGDSGYGNYTIVVDDNQIHLCVDELNYTIKQSNDISDFHVEKLADYMFLTNILDNKNLLVESHDGNISLERTAVSYNMEAILSIEESTMSAPSATQSVSNTVFYWAAAFNDKVYNGVYTNNNTTSTSYLLPAVALYMYISPTELSSVTTAVLDNKGTFLNPLLKGLFSEYEGVNVYYTLNTTTTTLYYKTTNKVKEADITKDRYDLYGKKTFDVSKKDTSYTITSFIYPVAVGSFVTGINYIQPTMLLSENYAVQLYLSDNKLFAFYLWGNRVYNGDHVFTIYGSNYYYDGQGIYFLGRGSSYASNQFVCYALGLKFLANSGSEAYFYSPFEKRLFIFTGSNTMQPADLLSEVGLITDAMFSSHEQMLYMLTDDNRVIIRSSTDTCALDDVPDNSHLEGTDDGAAICWKNGFFIYSPYKGTSFRPFKLETEYLGDDENLQKCSYIDVLLYKLKDKPIKVTFKVHTLNGIEEKTETETEVIGVKDWKGRTYRKRFSPRLSTGNAFKISIESDDEIAVSFINFEMSTVGKGSGVRR